MNTFSISKKNIICILAIFFVSTFGFSDTAEQSLQKSLSKIITKKDKKEQKSGIREFKKEMVNNGYKTFPSISKVINLSDNSLKSHENLLLFADYDRSLIVKNFQITGEFLGQGKFQKFTGMLFDNLLQVISQPVTAIKFFKSILTVIYNASYLLLYLLGIVFFIKYVRLLYHDYTLRIGSKLKHKHVVWLVFIIILFAPLFLTIKFYYLPFYWLILFVPYQLKHEIKAVFAGYSIAIVVTFAAIYLSMVAMGINTDEYRCYYALTTPFSNYTPEKEGDLQTFTSATIELRSKNFREAVALYKKIDGSSSFFPLALNNLGVAYFKLQELALARDFFNDALKKMDKSFLPHFNLSVTHLKNFNLAESSNELATAFNYNSSETLKDMMVNIKQVNPIIATPSIKEITYKLFTLKIKGEKVFSNLSGFKDLIFLVVFLVIFLAVLLLSQTKNTSKACSKCGKPFVYLESQNVNLCKQCVTVFVNKDDMDSTKRKDKISDIKKYNNTKKYIETFFSFVFPGLFDICLLEHVIVGVLFFMVFAGSLISVLFVQKTVHSLALAIPLIIPALVIFVVNFINVIAWYKDE